MKKNMLLVTAVILASITLNAQQEQNHKENKYSVAVSSCPIVGFTSDELNNNDNAGFAKTGFNINMNFSYLFYDHIAISSTAFYSRQKINSGPFHADTLDGDQWQSYGIVAGPMWIIPVGEKITGNVSTMFGVTNVSSPSVNLNGNSSIILKEKWALAMTVQLSAGLHYNFTDNFFLLGSLDLQGMRPKFKVANAGSTFATVEQRITTLTFNGGIGFNF